MQISHTRRFLAAVVLTTGAVVGGMATPATASPNADARLERLCEARGGSFHINRYGGTNLICSAATDGGHEFRPERDACAELLGTWEQAGTRRRPRPAARSTADRLATRRRSALGSAHR